MEAPKQHPLYVAISNAADMAEKEMHGQLDHTAKTSFSSVQVQGLQIEMAGRYAKAWRLLTEAKELIPSTYSL